MTPSITDEVSCNGPCRKRFRPAAVNMDQATASVLLSTCRTPGLQWLCPECHASVNLQLIANRDGTNLPPELWIEIFRNLDKRSMLRVRSTCRRWRDIVDQNQSLRKEFDIRFLFKRTSDEQFSPVNLFPASSATFFRATIVSVDAWWPPFGAGLTELFLGKCEVALPVLLGMLKETPNLTKLTLGCINYTTAAEEVEVDLRLEKLEYLQCCRVFDVFRNMAPRLRILKLSSQMNGEQEAKACRLLEAVQGTLKELEGNLTPFMLEKIAGMDRLELKNVVHRGAAGLAVQLSRIQLSIEELDVIAVNEDLCKIGRNLTKLRKARVDLKDSGTVVPSFLDKMPLLKVLHLEGICAVLDLNLFKSAHLISLNLNEFHFTGDCLQRYLTNCPNLQLLNISNCALDSWSDISTARFNSLRSLRLWDNLVDEEIMSVPEKLINLTELNISDRNMTTELLVKLLLQCPQLAKLTVGSMETINDEFVGMVSRFPQLRELHIYDCPLTDKSVKLVVDSGSHLRVQLDCDNISDAAIDLLSYVMRSR